MMPLKLFAVIRMVRVTHPHYLYVSRHISEYGMNKSELVMHLSKTNRWDVIIKAMEISLVAHGRDQSKCVIPSNELFCYLMAKNHCEFRLQYGNVDVAVHESGRRIESLEEYFRAWVVAGAVGVEIDALRRFAGDVAS